MDHAGAAPAWVATLPKIVSLEKAAEPGCATSEDPTALMAVRLLDQGSDLEPELGRGPWSPGVEGSPDH